MSERTKNFNQGAAVVALLLLMACQSVLAQLPETATQYASWKDRIVQIQVIDLQASSKAGTGSGFFAGRDGWIVTNYHVISDLVNEPGRYQAKFLADEQREGVLELLAVDPVHDLALLKTDGFSSPALSLASALPPKGTRLWSMGFPFDIGLTIVEGTFNGQLQKSMYEKLHFTGSINPGMSGGPTLDENGAVVGVNVSTAGNQVSFLVPVRHVRSLLERGSPEPPDSDELNREVADQLLKNQQRIADDLLNADLPVTRLNGYSVPAGLADYINCWGNSEQDEENRLDLVYYRCQTRDDIYLSRSLNTAIIQYQHDLISTDSLGPMRFYRQLEKRGYYPRLRLDGDDRTVSNYQCQSGFVEGDGMPMKVTWCVRSYLKLEGLYDAFLSSTSLVNDDEALQSTLILAGFSWENLDLFASSYLGGFKWAP